MRTTASLFSESPASPKKRRPDNGSEQAEQEHGFEWVELISHRLRGTRRCCRLVSCVGAISAHQCGRHCGYFDWRVPIVKEAFENIIERKMTMELSMTIALLSALAIGEFFTALVITGFVLAAEVLEGLTVRRGRRAIQDLLDFLPRTT
jgi:hypothetical protein